MYQENKSSRCSQLGMKIYEANWTKFDIGFDSK